MKTSAKEAKQKIEEKQSKMSYEDVKAILARRNDYLFELDKLEPQKHNWVDRGLKMSCENAGHPHHQAFKSRPKMA
jgi:hypothetical protein